MKTVALVLTLLFTAYSPKLAFSAEALGEGEQRTRVHTITSDRPGPTVLVVAGIHGNEPAPPYAADELTRIQLVRGTLVIVPRANQTALAAGSRYTPGARSRDLNRNFPIAQRPAPRGSLATALWQLVERTRPDFLLDLHEGWGYSRTSSSMGSSVVYVPNERLERLTGAAASTVLHAINITVENPNKQFALIQPGPSGSLARSATEQLGVPSLVFETTRTGQPIELRVRQHLIMSLAMLRFLRMLEA